MTIVFGVDPGELTGIFTLGARTVGDRLKSTRGLRTVHRGLVVPQAEVFDAIGDLILAAKPDAVSVERFFITQRTAQLTRQPAALEVTGTIRALCREHGVRFIQGAKSDAVKLGNDRWLRELGWYTTGRDSDHVNDAARQALHALATVDPTGFEMLVICGTIG